MPTQRYTSLMTHSARDAVAPDLSQNTEPRIWCTACGDEVADPATHICSKSDDTVRNAGSNRR